MASADKINFLVYKLASDLDKFSKEFVPYEYMDNVEDSVSHVHSIYDLLVAGQCDSFKSYLSEFIYESQYEAAVQTAKELLTRLEEMSVEQANKLICVGCQDNSFFAIQQHDGYFSLWTIDSVPKDMTPKGIEEFIMDHVDEGGSVAGSWEQIKAEFQDIYPDVPIPDEFKNLGPDVDEPLKPFRVAIAETYVKEVIIYAEDSIAAEEIADELCSEGTIDFDYDHFAQRTMESRGEVRPMDFEIYEVYNKPLEESIKKPPENCNWFALTDDKCISVWYAPDKYDGDQLQMHLEACKDDGSMGPGCEVLSDESYSTSDLSPGGIYLTLCEICLDAGFSAHKANEIVPRVTDAILATYNLKKPSLDHIISSASQKTKSIIEGKDKPLVPDR